MSQYDNTNSGVLFKNDRKEKDSHPDYKGQINIDGQEFWISSWIKTGQKGKFMSLAVTPKEQSAPAPRQAPARQAPAPKPAASGFEDMDDDVPW